MSYFKHCPICGSKQFVEKEPNVLVCGDCDFHYHHNPVVAVAAILPDSSGRILLIRRANNPAKGRLGMPGGFVDIGETAEGALKREVKEEVNLDLSSLEYLSSHPNDYLYRERVVPVLDLFFVCRVNSWDGAAVSSEVDGLVFRELAGIDPTELAFSSMRTALEQYRRRVANG